MPTIHEARDAIAVAHLPPAEAFAADAPAGGGLPDFDPGKEQSLVIGADVVSFGTGVEAEFRQAISDSALFAQLMALQEVGQDADPMLFFDAYFRWMMRLGWLIQQRDTSELDVKGDGLDVHQAITGVITAFLAPIAGAAQAVLAVLDGLYQMNGKAPFITLFNKRSTRQKIGRFQFTYVRQGPDRGLLAEMAAFGLAADEAITQILFFKIHKNRTSVRRSLGRLSIPAESLDGIRVQLAAKVQAYRLALIAEADLGPVAA
nr:hypothetical protein [uncultured Sphingomonas sp.]